MIITHCIRCWCFGFVAVLLMVAPAPATEAPVNIPLPTLGGKQIWADEFIHAGWRIQKNVVSGHYRLLDADDVRRAWGTYGQCRTAFSGYRAEHRLEHRNRHLIILVHGLGRSAGMFADLTEVLRGDGYEAVAVNYASTRESITAHAGHLAQVIADLDGIDRVSFVTHSMGGLVVRALLARPDVRDSGIGFGRLVMIAPPNRGSAIAGALEDVTVYRWLTTGTGPGLTPEGAGALPVPAIEFAVIAGGRGDGIGFNPFLDGDDDGVVTVEETKLDAGRDFLIVPSPHGMVDDHPATIQSVRNFLKYGRFEPSKTGE